MTPPYPVKSGETVESALYPGARSSVFRAVLPVSLGGPKCVKIGCLRDALSVGVRRADPVPSPGMLFLVWLTLPL